MSKVYPSSSVKPKDWDKIVGDIYKEDDKLEADDALNAIFQKIYAEGSDEVKKAMNKSFVSFYFNFLINSTSLFTIIIIIIIIRKNSLK